MIASQLQRGMKVKTSARLRNVSGIHPFRGLFDSRRPNALGVVTEQSLENKNYWHVRHEDGNTGVYLSEELEHV